MNKALKKSWVSLAATYLGSSASGSAGSLQDRSFGLNLPVGHVSRFNSNLTPLPSSASWACPMVSPPPNP